MFFSIAVEFTCVFYIIVSGERLTRYQSVCKLLHFKEDTQDWPVGHLGALATSEDEQTAVASSLGVCDSEEGKT